jgi:hypothetical protein
MIVVTFDRKPTTFREWYDAIRAQYGADRFSTGFLALLGWLKG